MSILRVIRGGRTPSIIQPVRSGSLLLPRELADQQTVNWPKCARCKAPVSAYGVDNDTEHTIDVWARCDGIQPDGLEGRRHAPRRAGFTIDKRSFSRGWTPNTLTDVLRRMALEPGGNGKWKIRLGHPDVVEPS